MRNRAISVVVLFWSVFGGSDPARAQNPAEDERAIRALIESHAVAWNRRDVKAAAAVYADNATIRTSSGREYLGRADVDKWHADALSGPNASTHTHPPETIKIYVLRPDLAVADLESLSPGTVGPDGNVGPSHRVRLFIVLTKAGAEWRVAAQRPTTVPLR